MYDGNESKDEESEESEEDDDENGENDDEGDDAGFQNNCNSERIDKYGPDYCASSYDGEIPDGGFCDPEEVRGLQEVLLDNGGDAITRVCKEASLFSVVTSGRFIRLTIAAGKRWGGGTDVRN
ncbi:MAG: hypothetical protein Kow0090_10370 [Myxococcota bacterium]